MSGGANIVEQYAGADVPARIELLIKYYPKQHIDKEVSAFIREGGFD